MIPIRRADDGLQICLIRRKDRSSWSVPKGYIDPGDDWERAALGEADEEAGVRGRILGKAIGAYDYQKGPLSLTVVVGVMEVLEERATWREMRWRERRWCSIEEAAALLRGHPIWPLYEQLQPSLVTILLDRPPKPPGSKSTDTCQP